ncbi:MAG: hypothetical protein ACRC7N_19655 [Clostridium sp.]
MNNIKAFAEFAINGKEIYRYNTIIKLGESDNIITSFILCNPNSSEIISKTHGNKQVEISIDQTMRGLIKIVKEIYGDSVEGEIHIFNLLTIKANKIDNVQSYKDNKFVALDFHYFKKNYLKYQYVIIGWGCEKSNNLHSLKNEWIKFLVQAPVKYIGIKGKSRLSYLHPLPPSFVKQEEYKNNLLNEISKVSTTNVKSKIIKLNGLKKIEQEKYIDNTIYVHNGIVLEEIEIFLDEKDILIANGFISRGRYIGVYEDSLGIYLSKGCKEPILTLFKKDSIVYINEYLGKEKTVVIEFNNAIKEDDI